MKAATPQGELPSDGRWCVLRRLSHGDITKIMSGFSIDESHRTMTISTNGTTKRIQPICSSVVSTMSSQLKNQDMPRNIDSTAKIKRTGYGRGFRVKASKMESLLLLQQCIAALFLGVEMSAKLSKFKRSSTILGPVFLQQRNCL